MLTTDVVNLPACSGVMIIEAGGRRAGLETGPFEDFYANGYSQLVAAVGLMTGSREDAQDAVDEALARAWTVSRRGEDPSPWARGCGWWPSTSHVAVCVIAVLMAARGLASRHCPPRTWGAWALRSTFSARSPGSLTDSGR